MTVKSSSLPSLKKGSSLYNVWHSLIPTPALITSWFSMDIKCFTKACEQLTNNNFSDAAEE